MLEIVLAGLPAWRLELPLGYIYKSPYRWGGLSQRLWNMEGAVLGNKISIDTTDSPFGDGTAAQEIVRELLQSV